MVGFTPTRDIRELLGREKDIAVRQLQLYSAALEQGERGWPARITHLDNVAERLVRAAYVRCDDAGPAIKQRILSSLRQPDYGEIIQALSSVKKLHGVQARLKTLRELRSTKTELPHPGEKPDEADLVTAETCFKDAAKAIVGVLDQSHEDSSQ